MRDKITVYGLLSKIYNENKDIPKKIEYDDIIWKYSNDAGDYYSERNQCFFGKNFNEMEAKVFLQSEVEIIQDNKIELDLYTNARCGKRMTTEEQDYNWELISKNFEIINKKLNEVLNERD